MFLAVTRYIISVLRVPQ